MPKRICKNIWSYTGENRELATRLSFTLVEDDLHIGWAKYTLQPGEPARLDGSGYLTIKSSDIDVIIDVLKESKK